jgi:parvulin-like peptidyl-prolyl isomerase
MRCLAPPLIVLALLTLLGAGCGRVRQASPGEVLAVVNGEPITGADLDRERRDGLTTTAAARGDAELLEGLIDDRLMMQRAQALGLEPAEADLTKLEDDARAGAASGEWQARLARGGLDASQWKQAFRRRWMLERVVEREVNDKVPVTAQEVRDFYWEHLGEFRRKERRRILHLVTGSRGDAEKALQEIKLGEPFTEVARRYSRGPEAGKGGDLGWLGPGDLPKPLASLAFSQPLGRVSGLIKTAWGWHLVLPAEAQPAVSLSLEGAEPQIRRRLKLIKGQEYYQAWLYSLRKQARIERPAGAAFKVDHAKNGV